MERDDPRRRNGVNVEISTHTLTWSVTRPIQFFAEVNVHFNSHAHVERDFFYTPFLAILRNFNSHAHVERDQIMVHNVSSATNFNSHAHVERDISADVFKQLPCISTHTLTWSVTCIDEVADQCVEISTHTLTWSVTSSSRSSHGRKAFQLTRSRGA